MMDWNAFDAVMGLLRDRLTALGVSILCSAAMITFALWVIASELERIRKNLDRLADK